MAGTTDSPFGCLNRLNLGFRVMRGRRTQEISLRLFRLIRLIREGRNRKSEGSLFAIKTII